jgi:hypothetical protein
MTDFLGISYRPIFIENDVSETGLSPCSDKKHIQLVTNQ